MRNMARIEIVRAVRPIPKADAIEVATIGGWNVVVKKDDAIQGGYPVVYPLLGQKTWRILRPSRDARGHGPTVHSYECGE